MADEQIAGMVVQLSMENGSFNEGIQHLNRQMKLVDSEFKTAMSGAEGFGDSLDGLKLNSDRLSQAIQIQSEIVEKYKEKLENSKNTLSKHIDEHGRLEKELKDAQAAYEASSNSLGKNADETIQLAKEVEKLKKELGDNEQKIRLSQKAIDNQTITVNKAQQKFNEYNKELNETKGKISNLASEASQSKSIFDQFKEVFSSSSKETKILGVSLSDLGGSMKSSEASSAILGGAIGGLTASFVTLATQGIGMAITALIDFTKESLQIGVGFEAQMSRVQAITGETSQGLVELTDIAREFGADTVFTTKEVSEAMEYMGMAGWKTSQIIGGMDGVLSLAAASGEDLALVSDTVTDVLTALGESASEAGRMADVFAAASTNSNTNVGKMAYTMKYAAPVAGALSYTMEDVAIATGLMANAGIKGETAGTSLRAMFVELQGAVEITGSSLGKYILETQNADGTMRELSEIMGDLRFAFSGLTEAERALQAESLVGKEAMSGLLAIVNASNEDFNKLTESIYNSAGAAEQMSQIMIDNVDGTLESIGSKFESVQISLFTFFEPLIKGALDFADSFIGVIEPAIRFIGDLGNVAFSALNPVFELLSGTVDIIGAVVGGVVDLLDAMASPVFEAFKGIIDSTNGELEASAKIICDSIGAAIEFITPLFQAFGETLSATLNLISGNFDGFVEDIEDLGHAVLRTGKYSNEELVSSTQTSTELMSDAFVEMASDVEGAFNDSTDAVKSELDIIGDVLDQYYKKELKEYEKYLEKKNGTSKSGMIKTQQELAEMEQTYANQMQKELAVEEEKLKKREQMAQDSMNRQMQAMSKQDDILKEQTKAVEEEAKKQISWIDKISNAWDNVFGGNKDKISVGTSIKGYATGTQYAPSGYAIVGENGRELIEFSGGERVINNNQTEQILNNSSTTNSGPIVIQHLEVKTDNAEDLLDQLLMLLKRGAYA